MGREVTPEWADWIQLNIRRGCDKDGIFKILIDEGFSRDQIIGEMIYEPLVDPAEIVNPLTEPRATHLHLPNAQRLETDRAEIYLLDDFVGQEDCDHLITVIKSRLRRSEIAHAGETDSTFRTSRTCDLGILDDPLVADVDRRICETLGVNETYSEVIQGQYYQPGEQFKAHTDYFEAGQIQQYASRQGQRTYTFMIYLNDVENGGETEFSQLAIEVKPRRGRAVIWNNLTAQGIPNPNTIHRARPVIQGFKCIITKWFRTNGAGPMYMRG